MYSSVQSILLMAKTWELIKQSNQFKSWNALLPGVLTFCAMDIEVAWICKVHTKVVYDASSDVASAH